MIDFSVTPTLPQSNVEVEMALLGSILLDPSIIYQVADTLPKEAFYVDAHKDIYQACLSLHKQQKAVTLLTVSSWLTDKGTLQKVGGRNKLAILIDNCVSTANVDAYVELLIEKHVRRQLSKLALEIDSKAHEEDKPLAWTLENLEQRVLGITQLRNAKNKGYWQKIDDIAFERLCKELEEIELQENAAHRDWLMRKLAKKWKFSSKKELLDFHAKWLDSQNQVKTYSAKEYFEKYGLTDQDWLIPGFVPAQSVIAMYADGGVGKTRLAFSLAKSAVSGGVFAYEGTEFEAMSTLLIETDQGPRITSKLLEMQELNNDQAQQLHICDDWSVGEFGKLKSMLKQHQPKLVIIDSLTSISVDSLYSENDTEYARPLVRLRHIAKEFGCSFLIIHHSNANGDMRGSRSIKNTVDEVWKFTKTQNEIETFNVLTIEKTRSRAPGSYKFTYDDESWGWKFGGRIEDNAIALGAGLQSTNIMSRCIKFLKDNRGVPYEAIEVANSLGLNSDSVRRDLKRAVNEGLINSGRSTYSKRALVYYVGTRLKSEENITTDQLINLTDQPLISSLTIQDKEYRLTDQLINENPENLNLENFQTTDQFDQLISCGSIPDIATELTDQPQLINSDQLISSVDQLQHSVTIPDQEENAPSLSQQAQPEKPSPTAKNREVGEVYLSRSLKKQVKIIKIYPSTKKADVIVKGDSEAKPRLLLSDLFPVPRQPWTPDTGKLADYGGELVEIVGFTNGGKKFQVQLCSGKTMHVNRDKLKCPTM